MYSLHQAIGGSEVRAKILAAFPHTSLALHYLCHMQLIEVDIKGKRPDQQLCEDGYVLTPDFAAVVDGSTSKVAGRHGGRLAMQTVCTAIRSLPPEADKWEMLTHLTQALAALNPLRATHEAQYRLTCSAVIFSVRRRVVWLAGDCQCRWGGRTFQNPKMVDSVLTQIRTDALRYLLAHGHTVPELRQNDLGRACIADALREQTNFQNCPDPANPYAYPVLDGTPVCASQVPELSVPAEVKECILASDGYPQLADTLQQSEECLHTLLQTDPLCMDANAATKGWMEGNGSFDDRCYLRIAI